MRTTKNVKLKISFLAWKEDEDFQEIRGESMSRGTRKQFRFLTPKDKLILVKVKDDGSCIVEDENRERWKCPMDYL